MTETLDAPVTTIEYDADESRPLQQLPSTEFMARWEQIALGLFVLMRCSRLHGAQQGLSRP